MPKRILALGAAAAAVFALPAAAHADVTDVTITQNGTATINQPASFTANATTNGGLVLYRFASDCADPAALGAAPAQASATYTPTFTTAGTHTVCVYAESQGVAKSARSASFVVADPSTPGPTAVFKVTPASAATGQTVSLDATGSTSGIPGGLHYFFDVDGDPSNGYEVDNGTNPVVTHVYANNFRQNVGVQVTDAQGRNASASAALLVSAPVVAIETPAQSGPPKVATTTGDGPLVKVTFTAEKTTIQQFLTSGLVSKLTWGDVFGKASVKYYYVTTTGKGKKKKTKKTLIVSAADTTFSSPGSSFTRKATGKVAKTLRKLKTATIEVDWTVVSKKGDKKTGVYKTTIKQGQR